jgi:hypothetical protein
MPRFCFLHERVGKFQSPWHLVVVFFPYRSSATMPHSTFITGTDLTEAERLVGGDHSAVVRDQNRNFRLCSRILQHLLSENRTALLATGFRCVLVSFMFVW